MGKVIAECSLAELVEDPLVGLLMKSDGVDRAASSFCSSGLPGSEPETLRAADLAYGTRRPRGGQSVDARG